MKEVEIMDYMTIDKNGYIFLHGFEEIKDTFVAYITVQGNSVTLCLKSTKEDENHIIINLDERRSFFNPQIAAILTQNDLLEKDYVFLNDIQSYVFSGIHEPVSSGNFKNSSSPNE